MPAEIDLYGVYVPGLLVLAVVTIGLHMVVRRALAAAGVYALVWHRALFDIAIYLLLLGALWALSFRLLS